MMAKMKSGQPLIRIRRAYPRVLRAANNSTDLFAPRLFIAGSTLGIAALVYLGRLLLHSTSGSSPISVGLPWLIPFVVLLAGIAFIPAIFPLWWEKFYAWFCLGVSVLAALAYLWVFHRSAEAELSASLATYCDFIVLLSALFIIASGIVIRVKAPATVRLNVLMLLGAAILSNVFGSMGASVLLARPFLRMNQGHIRPFHVIFFVLVVANVGASLTALGDPPLLLGYLSGIPFWWITIHAWRIWLLAVGLLLAMFCFLDFRHRASLQQKSPAGQAWDNSPVIQIDGVEQLLLLPVAMAGLFLPPPWRDATLVIASGVSLLLCPADLPRENRFNFQPVREIGILFLAIFLTMTPALHFLNQQARAGKLTQWLHTSGQCFFTTGALSAVLDNAPTYLAILQLRVAESNQNSPSPRNAHLTHDVFKPRVVPQQKHSTDARETLRLKLADPDTALAALAISLGSVFFGALTWIGNGPNLMIRAIAQQEGVACPGFVSYSVRYALPCLLPVLLLVWLMFFR